MRKFFVFLAFISLSQLILAQGLGNDSSSIKKNTLHVTFNFPTTKGLIYAVGAEWQHPISKKTTYVISSHISAITNAFEKHSNKSTQLLINLQPIGVLIGEKKWKFESNISFSYNAVTGKGVFPTNNNQNEVYLNIFVGSRFVLKKIPLSIHFGLMPRYNLVGDYYWYNNGEKSKWVPGFDLGFTYKIKG